MAAIPILLLCAGCGNQNDLPEQVEGSPVIHASFAGYGSRTVLKDESTGNLEWVSGDAISLFIGTNAGLKYSTNDSGDTATFTKDASESGTAGEGSSYIGLYPYDADATYDGTAIKTEIPSVQTAVLGSHDHEAFLSTGKSDNTEMGFNNVCGGIRFTLENPEITSVVLKGANNEALAGEIGITINADNIPVASAIDGGEKEIRLVSEMAMGNNESKFYYISMIPQTLANGFVLEFYKGNELYITSTCEKSVTIKRGVFSTIRHADDPESIGAPMDGEDLSTNGKANCYIVSKAGTFKFPAMIGNSTESVSAAYAKVLWETDNTETAVDRRKVIERCSFNNGYIFIKTPAVIRDGNALIAAYDDYGHILWSWHIWVCNGYNADATAITISGSGKIMDRNLGAISSVADNPLANGLFYQWGRKDPFFGTASNTLGSRMEATSQISYARNNQTVGSENFCIANPGVFYLMVNGCENDWYYGGIDNSAWSTSKTINDPCPAGWRVPDTSVWASGTGSALYPACGYMDCNTGAINYAGEIGGYWSVTSQDGKATILEINGGTYSITANARAAEGRSVRCIKQ